jgi:hypothetical protein
VIKIYTEIDLNNCISVKYIKNFKGCQKNWLKNWVAAVYFVDVPVQSTPASGTGMEEEIKLVG